MEQFIILLPSLFFLSILLVSFRLFRKSEMGGSMFTEVIQNTSILPNTSSPKQSEVTPSNIAVPATLKKSASRIVLFLTGLTTLVIAITILTYYLYTALQEPSLGWVSEMSGTKVVMAEIELFHLDIQNVEVGERNDLLRKMKTLSDIKIAELETLMELFLFLGIGIVPYGANQLKGLFK